MKWTHFYCRTCLCYTMISSCEWSIKDFRYIFQNISYIIWVRGFDCACERFLLWYRLKCSHMKRSLNSDGQQFHKYQQNLVSGKKTKVCIMICRMQTYACHIKEKMQFCLIQYNIADLLNHNIYPYTMFVYIFIVAGNPVIAVIRFGSH
jgi:hypothetical protein